MSPVPMDATSSFERLYLLLIGNVTLVRLAVKQLLNSVSGIIILGEAGSGEEAIILAKRSEPDMAIIAIQRFDETWATCVKEIQTISPRTRSLVLVDEDDGDGLFRAAEHGVWGYLPQNISQGELVRAIHLIARGQVVIACALAPEQFARLSFLNTRGTNNLLPLSNREFAVIKAMAEGYTDRQIAHHLGLSVPTVKTHVRSILRKTRSRNRAAAIAVAFRHGVIS
ncbi:MAG: response regulator transcription factor [Armatimonadota bacterium]|nr:response regulator transcription factor [Armatimonadota bacterium]